MAKLSPATEYALSVIAHVSMASRMDKEIEGMAGFYDFYRKQMSAKDREILKRFEQLSKKAHGDLADMLKQDTPSNNGR